MAVVDRINKNIAAHAAGDFSFGNPGDYFKTFQDRNVTTKLAIDLLKYGPVARKTVKQTIMTTVYGVTLIGGKEQIHKQLKAKAPETGMTEFEM